MTTTRTQTVRLTAGAAYGTTGQYIARITGRDPKFTFARQFVGRKEGKRGETSAYTTDEPGLYITCDVDKNGNKEDSFGIVYDCPGLGLHVTWIDRDDAMALAKSPPADWTRAALELRLAYSEAKPPEGEAELKDPQLGLPAGKITRSVLVEALRTALAQLNAGTEVSPHAASVARVRALMVELGVTVEDLA